MTGILNRITRLGKRVARQAGSPAQGRSVNRFRLMTELTLGRDCDITPQQLEDYRAYMHAGDPLGDAVAEWMAEVGFRTGMEQFEQVLNHGLGSVPDAAQPLRALFEAVEKKPAWLDEAELLTGQRAIARAGVAIPFILGDIFLLGGYGVSVAMNKALVMTGGLREGSTRKRANETSAWWLQVTREGGLQRDQDGFKTTLRVRVLHGVVRRRLKDDANWSTEAHGLPINQAHMAATGHAFGAGCLVAARMFGIRFNEAERAAFMHLWRYANWLMGVDEQLNTQSEHAGMSVILMSAMTAPEENEYAGDLAESYLAQVQYEFPKLGVPGRALSHVIANGRLGLAWLGLGRTAYRNLGLPERRAWMLLPLAGFGVLNAREAMRAVVPGADRLFTTSGRWIQETQIRLMRAAEDQPDEFIPYDERQSNMA